MGQIARRPLLNGRREDVAARSKQHALALRAERYVFDHIIDRYAARAAIESFVGNVDGKRRVLLRFRIEYLKLAVQFIDYAAIIIARRPPDVPRLVEGHLRGLRRWNIVGIKIEMAVAVRVVVDGVSEP